LRGNLWKLSYPVSYRTSTATGTTVIITGEVAEWVMSPMYVFGLSYYF
jgi:hypothetical protein